LDELKRSEGVRRDAPRRSFRSFRRNTAQALKDARATPAEIAKLIGHEHGFTLYAPMQLPVPALRELIERVKYPGLRLDLRGDNQDERAASIRMRMRQGRADEGRA
jgi:hypothetical protein